MSYITDGPRFSEPITIREALIRATALLKLEAVLEPRNNAELLLMHLLGMDRAALLRDSGELFPASRLAEWEQLVRRKAGGEPVQYMIGEQWFYGRPFTVTPAVLIPRPETELLVEAVLEAGDRLWPQAVDGLDAASGAEPGSSASAAVPTVIDVGTGSGAIAVTLASQRHAWRVSASDLSPDALAVARTNAARHEAADRMAFVQGDLLAPFIPGREQPPGSSAAPHAGLRIDVLVSNPPYIPAADLQSLQREVRDYEPHLALDGGADGLDPYRRMLEQLPLLAAMPRIVAFELGLGQPRIVADIMRSMGAWDEIRIISDYAGIERHVIAIQTQPC
ncbi:peptide chain release factor N(5)-glutamine methyltransferase [Paenibacillus alkaliterrae]|uniref:peptide chain release factor N(5)-glutamine methyltransferase n=1 Tax=Paenibacillus alkaliterrae TaxID=320909 RepID=UPI001F2B3F3D|nr:peptide chain release factor N(5)-glutamine methyltransferase [Paenibacillus alkaliterrae]MCF2938418.1 peptide chain release factor N(5)-glutamine methyltransferase [Paenibacillus alkaliterrae]